MKKIKLLTLLFAIAIIGQSCREDSDEFIITPPDIEPEVKVISSVLGTVTDDDGNAIAGATVTFEDLITFTDENGIFQFNDELLYSSGTYIKVTKDGFFDGSRKFYASEEKTARIAIELITLEEVAEFNSADGGTVIFENVELVFEANNIMNADGSPYSGNVNIAAKYLDPSLQRTLNQMPGDLTATTIDQQRAVLTSMAMIAVELFDDGGNELQIKEGSSVDVKIPVPESLLNVAPATIPMWYFDEALGTWIEEESAVLKEGNYEAFLPHFTFWNCDIPSEFVFLKGSIINREIPVQGVSVIVSLANGGISASTITDSEGFFCGYVPKGEDLILEVLNKCGEVVYSIDIPASEVDIFLDPFSLYLEANVTTISGSVEYCNGTPSAQTYVSVRQGTLNSVIVINEDFTFSSNIFYCDNNDELLVSAVDPINVVASDISTFNITGDIDGVELEMCEVNGQLVDPRDGQKYLTTEINGVTWTAENMRYDTDDGIPDGLDVDYSTVPDHYGRHYNYYSAQAACPNGWHLPSQQEFIDLTFAFSTGTSAIALKSTEDWKDNDNGTNSSGFNAFPAGVGFESSSSLDYVGWNASFWSSTKNGSTGRGLHLNSGADANVNSNTLTLAFSVRCIKD